MDAARLKVHVVGVGTPRGDDAAGLAVAEALARHALPPGVSVHLCERPVPDLLDALEGADAALLVDAARTGAAPGTLRRLGRAELARSASPSSHGLGVAEALALAEALGRAPARVELLALEIADPRGPALTPAVSAAIAGAARRALAIAREIQGLPAEGSRDA
jgi:hydrogenase maturation protease